MQQAAKSKNPFFKQAFILFIFIFICGVTALQLGQDISWDLLNYHYYNGYAYLHHRVGYDVSPALMQTYLNPFFDVINYGIISLRSAKVSLFLFSLNSAICAFLLYNIALLFLAYLPSRSREFYALIAVFLGMTGAGGVSLLGMTTNDVNAALMILISVYCLMKAISLQNYFRYAMAAGVITGLCVGFKLTAASFAIGLSVGLVYATAGLPRRKSICFGFIASIILGFIVANGYWMLHLYQLYQSPLYPYYNNYFHSPYAPYIDFNISPSRVDTHWYHYFFLPFYLLSPSSLYSERVLSDPRLAVILVLLFVLLFQLKKNKVSVSLDCRVGRLIWTFFAVSYFIWLNQFAVYRYLLPLEYLSGLAIVVLLLKIIQSDRSRLLALIGLVLIGLFTTTYPNWGRMNLEQNYFSVSTPSIAPNSTVLLASIPIAYVIPSFLTGTRFVGMPFVILGEEVPKTPHSPTDKHSPLMMKVMQDLLPKKNPLYILNVEKGGPSSLVSTYANKLNKARIFGILNHFGFHVDSHECQSITTNVGDTLSLCAIK